MAATVTGVFQIIDRASGPMRNMERQARKTDLAIRSVGDALDDVGTSRQLEQLDKVERNMRDVDRAAVAVGGTGGSGSRTKRVFDDLGNSSDRLSIRLGRTAAALTGIKNIIGVLKLPLLVAGIGALVQAVGALAGGLVAMTPQLVQAVAALGSMAAQVANLTPMLIAYPALLGGIALAAGAAKLAFQGFSDAVSEGGEALRNLAPRAREVAEVLRGAGRDFAREMQRTAQVGFFGQFNAQVLNRTLLSSGTQRAASQVITQQSRALGRGAANLASGLTTPTMLRQIGQFSQFSSGAIVRLSTGVNNLAYALADLLVTARPFLNWMVDTVVGWTQMAQRTAEQNRRTGELRVTFAEARDTIEQFGRIARNVWRTLGNVRDAADEAGQSMWNAAERGSRRWDEWTGSARGQQTMTRYFDNAREAVSRVWDVTKNLAGALIGVGRAADEAGDNLWESARRATQGWEDWANSVSGQTSMRVFFENIREPVGQLAGLVGDLGAAIMRVGAAPGFADTVATLRQAVEPLEGAIAAMGGNLGPAFAELVVQVSRLIEMLAGTGGGVLGRFVELFASLLEIVLNVVDAIPGLDRLFGAGMMIGGIAMIRRFAAEFRGLTAAIMEAAAAMRTLAVAPVGGRRGQASPGILPVGGGRGTRTRAGGAGVGAYGIPADWGRNLASGLGAAALARRAAGRIPGVGRLGRLGRAASRAPGLGALGGIAGGAARFLGPVGAAIMGGFALKDFIGTEGGIDRRAQAAASGLTFGIVPRPRSSEEAFAEGQEEQLAELERRHHSIAEIQEKIAQDKALAATADQIEGAELRGELQVLREQLGVLRQMRHQRQLARADELLRGPEGIMAAFDLRASATGPRRAMKAATEDVLGELKNLRGAGRVAMAENYLAWASEMEESNPKLKGLADDAAIAIENRMKRLGRRVEVVNGQIWSGTELSWENIRKSMTSAAERARQEVSESFTDIQRVAVDALIRMGMDPKSARDVIRNMESGMTERQARTVAGGKLSSPASGWEAQAANSAAGVRRRGRQAAGARGMRIPGVGVGDTVPIAPGAIAAPGELVTNRHTEQRVDRMLSFFGTSLGAEVAGEAKPHSASLQRHARGGRVTGSSGGQIVPVPGFPGERINSAVLPAWQALQRRFNLLLTDAYGPGHQSPEHTQYGTAVDVVPGPGGSWADVNRAVAFSVRAGYNPVYYDGSHGSINLPPHGPGHHAHITLLTAAELLGGQSAGGGRGMGGGALAGLGPAMQIALRGRTSQRGLPGMLAQRAMDGIAAGAERQINRQLRRQGAALGTTGPTGGSVRQWLAQALRITGHFSPQNLQLLLGRTMQESGGDPRAINLWDSNAAAGIPSKGLLQTIEPTFDAYALRGMRDIWNPVHNAVAAIRYMMARYGHIVGPGPGGYAYGGRLPEFAGWFGSEGTVTAHGPTLLGIGDGGGTETATITRGRPAAGFVIEGGLHIHNEKGETKDQIKEAVRRAFEELEHEMEFGGEDEDDLL